MLLKKFTAHITIVTILWWDIYTIMESNGQIEREGFAWNDTFVEHSSDTIIKVIRHLIKSPLEETKWFADNRISTS